MLDQALFRRFDDVLHYSIPDEKQIKKLFEIKLGEFYKAKSITKKVIELASGLSHTEISKACEDCIKVIILENKTLSSELIAKSLVERTGAYASKEA